eukprot:7782124-Alexandrium_andersonii.AAC.1
MSCLRRLFRRSKNSRNPLMLQLKNELQDKDKLQEMMELEVNSQEGTSEDIWPPFNPTIALGTPNA